MREVVMSSDEVDETAEEIMAADGDERRCEGLMRWEKFLPKIELRVLLVESDDSTSQIVAALLRKCNYKVAAASDGLKAWEIIKGRPHDIDLILTEVYLPSISGYALLTLIMEHEICKNIPVIMMSSQDSVSTVYKCMLKGAADYLVKPLRKNELRNLWQHVWRRRQSLPADANSPQEESVGQQKLEAASENNSASNQASGIKRDEDQTEKGSEAQSSCAKPDMEVESGDIENLQSLLQKKDGMRCTVKNANPIIVNKGVEPDKQMVSANEAFDFMGAFRSDRRVTDHETSTFDSSLELDLSLRRSNHISDPKYSSSGEKSNFRSSSASAFTRYVNRPIQTECFVSPNTSNGNREARFQQKAGSSQAARYSNSNAPVPPNIRSSETPWINQSSICNSIPAKDIGFENNRTPNTVYPSVTPSTFITQSSPSTTPSRCSSSPHETNSSLHPFQPSVLEKSKSRQLHIQLDGNNDKRDHKPDTSVDKQNVSLTADGFSNGMYHGSTSGSNISNVDNQAPATGANTENKTEDGLFSSSGGGKSQRSLQREAALAKFRMKRKDRCFEKKVRYESRKKLAEKRPRVKGQFVRQVNTKHVAGAEEEAETSTATRQNCA